MPRDEFEDAREMARQGHKIDAIKLVRDKTGWDLKEAKDFVESPAFGVPAATKTSKPSGGGCLVGILVLGGLAYFAYTAGDRMTPAPWRQGPQPSAQTAPARSVTSTPPSEPTYQLALTSSKGYDSEYGGYHIIEGQVRNVSNQPLKNVTAVGIWSDKNGEFIKSDDQGRFDQWLRVPESTVTSKLILPLPIPKHSILHVAGNVW